MKLNNLFLISLLALTVGLVSCGGKEKKTETVAEKPSVKLAKVFERNVPQIAEFTATIQPEVKNSIAPVTPGRIRRIMRLALSSQHAVRRVPSGVRRG